MAENPEDFHLKQIRTFQGDMAEALKNKGESVVTLAEREQVKQITKKKEALLPKQKEVVQPARPFQEYSKPPEPVIHEFTPPPPQKQAPPPPAPTPAPAYQPYQGAQPVPRSTSFISPQETTDGESHVGRRILLVLGTCILLALGGAGSWYAYTQYRVKTALPVIAIAPNQFLTPQSVFGVNTTSTDRAKLINIIRTERTTALPSAALHEIELREGQGTGAPLVTTEHFLVRYLESPAPGSLIRSFDPLFMLGTLGGATGEINAHTFLIIKLDSFENAFPGMLVWESTMARDILPLFATDDSIGRVASSTIFADVTIQNKDARVLKDVNGKTVLLYSFYDNNLLIITDNELSLRQLVSALNAKKTVR